MNTFEGDQLPTWITPEILKEHQALVAPHSCNEIGTYIDDEDPRYPKYPGRIADYSELRHCHHPHHRPR